MADEYNWIYTSVADGGSGICTANPETSTCIAPLNVNTGYASYIVPTETRIDMLHILGNDRSRTTRTCRTSPRSGSCTCR